VRAFDPVAALFLHRGETSHIETGAERPPLAGQYYRPNSLLMRKPLRGSDNRLEHRGIERVHLVRPHQSDVGNAVRNRDRNALLHENSPPLLFVYRFTERRCADLVNRPINSNSFGWKRCSTISFSPGGAFS
jgi:hypothetical protein